MNIFALFGCNTFKLSKLCYFKVLFLALSMDICLLLFMKIKKTKQNKTHGRVFQADPKKSQSNTVETEIFVCIYVDRLYSVLCTVLYFLSINKV